MNPWMTNRTPRYGPPHRPALVQSFKLPRMNGLQVKKPAESQMPWDDYKVLATIPGEQAFQPLSKSKCSLVKNP
ncbi:branched-chain amino acid ABC transporter substrate-binding protein [Curvibacter lanceolatus]|uniref:branched-chain amino acid ABC transporter substrate-binding protein n=1 Tax=Curvibacter lanceolatus TaxID=86182 RepID=UPI003B5B7A12